MPVLWCDRVIGWANAEVSGQVLDVKLGFVEKRPEDRDFPREVDAEVARLEEFLNLNNRSAAGPCD